MFVKGCNVRLAGRNGSPDQLLFLDGTFRITRDICKDGQVDKYSFQLYPSLIIKKILLEIGLIEEMRATWGNKEVPKLFFTIPLIRENTFKAV